MLTLEYWEAEVISFKRHMGVPCVSSCPRCRHTQCWVVMLVRGMLVLAGQMLDRHPGEKDRILSEVLDCIHLVQKRMGMGWWLEHWSEFRNHCDTRVATILPGMN